jgi:hypothetical protein
LRTNHGISLAEYEEMLSEQDGVCAICGKRETSYDPRIDCIRLLAVDHDHRTGMVRGLLCDNCNHMIGQAHDDPEVLRRAADYLERYGQEG